MITQQIGFDEAALMIKLLGDKTRLKIIALLEIDELCVCEFVDIFDSSQPSISQHLRKLRDKGLVSENRRGQWVFYSLNRETPWYELIKSVINKVPDAQPMIDQLTREGKRVVYC